MFREYSKIKVVLAGGFALLLLLLAYGRSSGVPFYLDDFPSLVQSPVFAGGQVDWSGLYAEYPRRWLAYASLGLNVALMGMEPAGMHVLTVVFHCLTAGAVFLLLSVIARATVARPGQSELLLACVAGLLFLLHPQNSQAVVYTAQRATALMALFYVAALACYVLARMEKKAWAYFLTAVFGVASWCSKESAATLPLALLVLEGALFQQGRKALGLLLLPFGCLLLAGLGFSLSDDLNKLARGTWLVDRSDYLATQMIVLWHYIGQFFLPIGLRLEYDFAVHRWNEPWVWLAASGHLVLLLLALRSVQRWPLITLGVVLYYVGHMVESSIVPLQDLAFEHRTYLPNVGLVLALAGVLGAVCTVNLRWVWRALAVLSVVLAGVTAMRVEVWRTPLAFHYKNSELAPHAYRTWLGLSAQYARLGDMNKANAAVNRALAAYQERHSGLSEDLLVAYMRIKCDSRLFAEAVDAMQKLQPAYEQSRQDPVAASAIYSDYGRARVMLGDLPGAEDTLQKAVRLNPRNASALNNLGALKAMQKDYAAARGYFQQGLLADPAHPEIRRNLEKLDALRAAN